jgi:NAD(P)-dependent dehydrogenase (short-subunit alcohol dehydrogenase family)
MSKTILVTGSSSGFGNDIAKTLASAGHTVIASMRDIEGRNREATKDLQSKGIAVIEMDVTNDASVDAAFNAISKTTSGKLDVVINNAGIFAHGLSEAFTADQTRQMFDVNVFGIQRVTRAALPEMRKNKSGLIVNVGSILGRVTIPFLGLYGASKYAVEAMSESYRNELSQLGVDVVVVEPSAYPTKLYASLINPADPERANGYGDVPQFAQAFGDWLQGYFAGENAPDPHDVAKEVLDLVNTSAGKRPARVVVGAPFGADAANTALKPVQEQLLASIGMDALDKLRVA